MDSIFHPYPPPPGDSPYPHSQFFSDWTGEQTGDFAGVENVVPAWMISLEIYFGIYDSNSVFVAAIGATYADGNGKTYDTYHGNAKYKDGNSSRSVDLSTRSVKELKVWAVDGQDTKHRISGIWLAFDDGTSEQYGADSGSAKSFAFEGQVLLALNGFTGPPQSSAAGDLAALGCVFESPIKTIYPYPTVTPPYPSNLFINDWTGEGIEDFTGVMNLESAQLTALEINTYVDYSMSQIWAVGATYKGGTNNKGGVKIQHGTPRGGPGLDDIKLSTFDLPKEPISKIQIYSYFADPSTPPPSMIAAICLTFQGGESATYGDPSKTLTRDKSEAMSHTFNFENKPQALLALTGFVLRSTKTKKTALAALGFVLGPPPSSKA